MNRGTVDHIRHSHARAEVHTERDRLLKRADKKTQEKEKAGDVSKDRARAIVISAGLTFPGMIGYLSVLMMWFYTYHESVASLVMTFIFLMVTYIVFIALSDRRVLGRERPWMWWVGVLGIQAIVLALVFGFFLYFRLLCYYWKYTEMRTYTNVAAMQDPDAFSDGSMILFTEDSQIDPMRSVGFKSRWTGETYCVSPIIDSAMNGGNDIHYWAIGENCCPPRGGFHCNDAADFSTRSALVVLEPEDVVRPFMRWAVRGSSYSLFMEAIRLEEAAFFTKAAVNPKLVYWTRDPIALKESFYHKAKDRCVAFSLCYFFAFLLFSFVVALWRLIPKQKSENARLSSIL